MNERVNPRRLLITLGIVLATAFVVGGPLWYVMNEQIESTQVAADEKVEEANSSNQNITNKPENTEVSKEATNNNTATASWLTYSNDQNYFSIKYPGDNYYQLKSSEPFNMVFFNNKYKNTQTEASDAVGLSVYRIKGDLRGWIEGNPELLYQTGSVKTATVAGQSGYSYLSNGVGGTQINYVLGKMHGGFTYAYVVSGLQNNALVKQLSDTLQLK